MDAAHFLQFLPLLSSFAGVLIGGAITWGITKTKIENLLESHKALEVKVTALEKELERERLMTADRMARVEVKLDDVRSSILRMEQR